MPAYYQDGLIAHQLMNQGFFALAKKIVLPIVNEHPEYILPYQILANTDFSMGKRASAASYFSQLLKLDPQEKNLYLYMLGVCYYQIGKYSDAVLYLAQISDSRILLDSDRYGKGFWGILLLKSQISILFLKRCSENLTVEGKLKSVQVN